MLLSRNSLSSRRSEPTPKPCAIRLIPRVCSNLRRAALHLRPFTHFIAELESDSQGPDNTCLGFIARSHYHVLVGIDVRNPERQIFPSVSRADAPVRIFVAERDVAWAEIVANMRRKADWRVRNACRKIRRKIEIVILRDAVDGKSLLLGSVEQADFAGDRAQCVRNGDIGFDEVRKGQS